MVMVRHVGALVPKEFRAPLFSLHDRVVNFILPEKLLVSLVTEGRDMTAMAFHTPDLSPRSVASGDELHRSGDDLVIVSPQGGKRRLSLNKARQFRGNPLPGRLSAALGEGLREAILESAVEEGFASLLGEPQNVFAKRATKLLRPPHRGGTGKSGPEGLVGLGIGFTPSGDDFLAGYLLAAKVAGESANSRGLFAGVRERLGKTTPGGATLLHLALKGSYPCYLLRFWWCLRQIGTGGAALEEAVRDAAHHGETSGLDAVTGFTWFVLTR